MLTLRVLLMTSVAATALGGISPAHADPNHVASVGDPDRVFHRLYIIGAGTSGEIDAWEDDLGEIQQALETAANQADGSTSTTLNQPTKDGLRIALERLKRVAQPGDEVTIYYSGHGYGGKQYGSFDGLPRTRDELYDEEIWINDDDGSGEMDQGSETLMDDDFAVMMKGFRDDVSISVLMDSCYGGGFTGTDKDLPMTDLVRLIGPYTQCPTDGPFTTTLTEDMVNAINDDAIRKDGIVTTQEVLNYLNVQEWYMGAPFDSDEDLRLGTALGYGDKPENNKGRGKPVNDFAVPVSVVTAEDLQGEAGGDIPNLPIRYNVAVTYGVGEVEAGRTGIGFQREAEGEEGFAGFSGGDLQTEEYGLTFFFGGDARRGTPTQWDTSISLNRAYGTSRSEFQYDPGTGINTGFVYGGLSPSGSSGVSIGDGGLWGQTEFDFSSFSLKAKRMAPFNLADNRVRPFYFGEIRHQEQTHYMHGNFSAVYGYYDYCDDDECDDGYYDDYYDGYPGESGGYAPSSSYYDMCYFEMTYNGSQIREQDIADTYYGGGLGLAYTQPLSQQLFIHGYASGGLYYRDSELNSAEWNRCDFCPSEDQDFLFSIHDRDTGTAFEGQAGFIMNYQLARSFGIAGYGSASYLTEAGFAENPYSGDQVYYDGFKTHLGTDEMTRWSLGVAAIVSLSEPR
ncbi:caspase family protein [Aquisalinus flavus]|uniref:Caspase family protein n=1 Tax=Aquisalinus flavus TaxID=1526572 RepID=A0A8J2V1A3_9PROT|nr:caspase family protein [Aquisalinus flavus]MBD0427857.1 caspase family protein [Aquisalinus flavus]UNE47621.1 hypothetical protein FF099_05915 [Aquisalinus flavus]GGD04434.1 hypothetical protein GCM10011342_11740 [Aquisalinus flavus]